MTTKGNCKAKDCAREAVGKGYCRQHFRLWKAGEMPKARYKTCTFEKCRKHRHGTSSLCDEHFKAKHGKLVDAAAAAPAAKRRRQKLQPLDTANSVSHRARFSWAA